MPEAVATPPPLASAAPRSTASAVGRSAKATAAAAIASATTAMTTLRAPPPVPRERPGSSRRMRRLERSGGVALIGSLRLLGRSPRGEDVAAEFATLVSVIHPVKAHAARFRAPPRACLCAYAPLDSALVSARGRRVRLAF